MSPDQVLPHWPRLLARRRRLLASCLLLLLLNLGLLLPPEQDSSWSPRPPPSRRQQLTSCSRPRPSSRVDFDAERIRPKLDLNINASKTGPFWSDEMEVHYQQTKRDPAFPLKIVLVSHSRSGLDWRTPLLSLHHTTSGPALDALVTVMSTLLEMTFTWTGVSQLQLWWNGASQESRQVMAGLIRSGRLEVTTAGREVPEDASTPLRGLAQQLTEGHQWLRQHVGVTPVTGISGGLSGPGSTLPYLLSQAGIRQTIVTSAPRAWVDYLAVRQSTDFQWQQQWDGGGTEAMLTHLQPHDGLSDGVDCGTVEGTSALCSSADLCQSLLRHSGYAQTFAGVSDENVKERAEALVAAAGRVASLSSHNVALVMVAAEFNPVNTSAWRERHQSLTQLARYINGRKDLNAAAEIATPARYFHTVRERAAAAPLARLSGDLHGAAGGDLFTDQPRWLRAARQLEERLRAVDQLLVWALGVHQRQPPSDADELLAKGFRRLADSRRMTALLSRRGAAAAAITPALAKQLVSVDNVLTSVTNVLLSALFLDLGRFASSAEAVHQYARLSSGLGTAPELVSVVVRPGTSHRLVVHNALAFERTEVVEFVTSTPNIAVQDLHGADVQLELTAHEEAFKAKFLAVRLPPVSMTTYHVISTDLGSAADPALTFDQTEVELSESLSISNTRFEARLNKSRLVLNILDRRHGDEIPLEIGLISLQPSGSDGEPANELLSCPERHWTWHEDSITSETSLSCGRLRLTLHLTRAAGAVGQALRLLVEAAPGGGAGAAPLLLRLRTTVRSHGDGGGFFADSSDYQMVQRSPATLPHGLRPATSQVSLQDSRRRISLLMDQARGVASPAEGELAAVLHPGGGRDDRVYAEFLLVFERAPEQPAGERELFASSPLVSLLSRQLNSPAALLFGWNQGAARVRAAPRLLSGPLPCDCELVALRQLETDVGGRPAARALLTLHRRRLDCRLWDERDKLGCRLDEQVPALTPLLGVESLHAASLTGAEEADEPPLAGLREVRLPADQVRSYIVKLDRQLTEMKPEKAEVEAASEERKKPAPAQGGVKRRGYAQFKVGRSYQLQL